MSNRNYRSMGETKLRTIVNDLDGQPEEDREAIVSIAVKKGILGPGSEYVPELNKSTKSMKTEPRLPTEFFKPMLAFDAGRPVVVPTGVDWVLEPKYDGIRFLVHKQPNGEVRCYGGRNGADHTGEAPGVERIAQTWPNDTLLDGELVVAGGQSGDTMSHLASRSGATNFKVFDVLRLDGHDTRSREMCDRRLLLSSMRMNGLFGDRKAPIQLVPIVVASQELFEHYVGQGWEGMVAKNLKGLYRSGKRSRDWYKLKVDGTAEAIVTGFKMGKGDSNKDRVGALEFRMLDPGLDGKCPKSSCSYDCELPDVEPLLGKHIEILHQGIFEKTGSPRHPRFLRMRPDRDEVTG